MSVKLCEKFGSVVKLSSIELDAPKALLASSPDLNDKLETHLNYILKRPSVADDVKKQWIAKLPVSAIAQAAPPALTPTPPPIASVETYTHAAIGGAAHAGKWTMASAAKACASAVWRAGLKEWVPVDLDPKNLSVQPAPQPVIPTVDGFPIPWPIGVELAKNGKLYCNLRGSLKPMGKGVIGAEVRMLKALLGDDSQYRQAILKEVEKLGG